MVPNQTTDATPIDMTELLQSFSVVTSNENIDKNQTDTADAISNILLGAAYEQIPAQAAAAIPGLELFEDSDNPGSWFWEWEWGECQDGPYKNELEALIAFARFSAELAIELGGEEDD